MRLELRLHCKVIQWCRVIIKLVGFKHWVDKRLQILYLDLTIPIVHLQTFLKLYNCNVYYS